MEIEVDRAIAFECIGCKEYQYHAYTLESDWLDGRAVNADHVDCEKCGKENYVYEEL